MSERDVFTHLSCNKNGTSKWQEVGIQPPCPIYGMLGSRMAVLDGDANRKN